MPSKQEELRERVVTFYLNHIPEPRRVTINHFKEEGVPKRTINNIITTYIKRKTTKRAVGSGQIFQKMSKKKVRQLYKDFNHSDKYSISSAARKYNVKRPTIKYWLKKRQIKRFRKKKSPKYSETQKLMVKRQCAWIYRYFRKFDFVIDDEKYFTLSHSLNNSYFSSPTKSTPDSVKFQPKQKFEPKVMLWIAISKYGFSRPYLRKSGLAVDQKVYLNECLKKRLIPFIKDKHRDNNYMFWPDKASAHYANTVTHYLNTQNIRFLPKYRNATNVLQCRPIEDFFGYLCQLVYAKGWAAQNTNQLINRIKRCLKKVDPNVVKRSVESVRKRIRICAERGPLAVVH